MGSPAAPRQLGLDTVEVVDRTSGDQVPAETGARALRRLVSAVCLERVGGVFALEASRLARNNPDWQPI